MGGLQSQRCTVVRKRLLEGNYDFVIIHYTAFISVHACADIYEHVCWRGVYSKQYFIFHYRGGIVLKGASFAVNKVVKQLVIFFSFLPP